MRILPGLLVLLITIELVAAGLLVASRRHPSAPPLPPVELFDRVTAAELVAQRDAVDAGSPEDWAALAERYLAHGFYAEAEACHRRACELAPGDARLRGLWAFCLSHMGRLEEGNRQYRGALKAGHPQAAQLHYFIGRNHLRLEDASAARTAFEQAGELPAARYELAKLALAENRAADAARMLQPLQETHPGAFAAHWLRARAERTLGNHQDAERFERLAGQSNERLPTPFDHHSDRIYESHNHFGLSQRWHDARELLQAGRIDTARALLEEALAARWQPQGADLLADVAHMAGRQQESLRLLDEILEREEPTLHRLWRYGDALQAQGHLDQAYQAWRHALTVGPETEGKGLYVKLSQHHAGRGDKRQANRLKGRYYCAAGVERLRSGRPAEALAALSESASIFADDPDVWFSLGQCHQQLQQRAKARDAYRRCLDLQPHHGRAHRALASLAAPN